MSNPGMCASSNPVFTERLAAEETRKYVVCLVRACDTS